MGWHGGRGGEGEGEGRGHPALYTVRNKRNTPNRIPPPQQCLCVSFTPVRADRWRGGRCSPPRAAPRGVNTAAYWVLFMAGEHRAGEHHRC